MTQYIKTTAIADAVKYLGGTIQMQNMPTWFVAAITAKTIRISSTTSITVVTTVANTTTTTICYVGDYIFQDNTGAIYGMKGTTFEATYQLR